MQVKWLTIYLLESHESLVVFPAISDTVLVISVALPLEKNLYAIELSFKKAIYYYFTKFIFCEMVAGELGWNVKTCLFPQSLLTILPIPRLTMLNIVQPSS